MSRYYYFISLCIILACAVSITAEDDKNIEAEDDREARCFQFTWLGPRWNNNSVFLNATCQDATRLSEGVPCTEPLVVSYDGSWPDVHYIWRNHRGNASCVLANNDVCVQYTHYFDGVVDNSTYMCTRAVDSNGQAISRGCYEQRNGSFVTRACFCRSIPGGVPCNNAFLSNISTFFVFFVAILIIFKSDFINKSV
uniref:SFRICE_000026 n=1 Tax=Spodoptera frugiperda TaxID=7108 RepID=A0A2H1V418_SPOFR